MSHYGFGFGIGQVKKAGAVSYDANAQAFFTATGITDTTQKSAVNQLVLDLKSYNIWSKMKAIYPMVGGTSTTHKYNLVNPVDSDAAFRLSFSTGWTHSTTGATPNGSSAYANTFLNPTTSLSSSNNHASIYNRTNTDGIFTDIGSYTTGTPVLYMLFRTRQSNSFILADGNSTFPSVTNTDSKGFYIMSKTSASNTSGFKNNSKVINSGASGTGISNHNIFIGAANTSGTVGEYSNRQCAFASIGDGLTDTEAANFYIAVQAMQTTLSRNV
jgi:hypothetical protein